MKGVESGTLNTRAEPTILKTPRFLNSSCSLRWQKPRHCEISSNSPVNSLSNALYGPQNKLSLEERFKKHLHKSGSMTWRPGSHFSDPFLILPIKCHK